MFRVVLSLVTAALFIGDGSASRVAGPAARTTVTATGSSAPAPRPAPLGIGKLDASWCAPQKGASVLPARTLHGLISRLQQYPAVTLATTAQRRAAQHLLNGLEAQAAAHWSTLQAAQSAGFVVKTVPRPKGDLSAHYVHAERLRQGPIETQLDVRRPKALIYANEPGRPLVLVGVMFSMRRGIHGPTPGGPITRWHSHEICAVGTKRGLTPRPNGSCPPRSDTPSGKRDDARLVHTRLAQRIRHTRARTGTVQGRAPAGPLMHEPERLERDVARP